jgi:hypothetical protein
MRRDVCFAPDCVAKVENRTTVKISRKSIFGLLCCCVDLQGHYGIRDHFWINRYGPPHRRAQNASAALRIFVRRPKKTFATKIGTKRTCRPVYRMSAVEVPGLNGLKRHWSLSPFKSEWKRQASLVRRIQVSSDESDPSFHRQARNPNVLLYVTAFAGSGELNSHRNEPFPRCQGLRSSFEYVWLSRDSHLDKVPGFVECQLLMPEQFKCV